MNKKHLWNIVGIIASFGLGLTFGFFGIWQLDMIVSGPVWWSDSGIGWSHPNGAYANDYFQCFLWKTTVGMAYDVLFLVIFLSIVLSLILLFISLWTWEDELVLIVENKGEMK